MVKVPRKLKKKIPKGVYCYSLINCTEFKSTIKTCVFYDNIKIKDKPIETQDEIDLEFPNEYIGFCKLVKCEIDDQCKYCGIKRFY